MVRSQCGHYQVDKISSGRYGFEYEPLWRFFITFLDLAALGAPTMVIKLKTLKMAKAHRINELQEDIMVVDFYLKSMHNKQARHALQNLKILLQITIFSLEKGGV